MISRTSKLGMEVVKEPSRVANERFPYVSRPASKKTTAFRASDFDMHAPSIAKFYRLPPDAACDRDIQMLITRISETTYLIVDDSTLEVAQE